MRNKYSDLYLDQVFFIIQLLTSNYTGIWNKEQDLRNQLAKSIMSIASMKVMPSY